MSDTMFSNDSKKSSAKVSWYHPLLRCIARLIDVNIFGLLIINFLYFVMPDIYHRFDKAFGFYVLLLWVFIEAIFLSTWGTTFGKWLLCITVKREGSLRISYKQAITRSFEVYVKACGLGLPIVWLVMPIISYINFIRNQATSWDKKCGFIVSYEKITLIRVLAIALVVLFLGALIFISYRNNQIRNQVSSKESLMSTYNTSR